MKFLCIACLCWNVETIRGQGTTSETLLNAYYDLWHQLGRQPTSVEVDTGTPFTTSGYLEKWDNWENVQRALVNYLYQEALSAALQQNTETTSEYYRKCLEIDLNHPQARAAYQADLDVAAEKREDFTREMAGSTALSYFMTFLSYREDGNEQAARDFFMMAQSHKVAYLATEVKKLQDVYNAAVELFNQGSFAQAAEEFRKLIELRSNQAGYREVYLPNASSIRQYLADAIYRSETEHAARFESRSNNARFTIWYTGNWMAQFGELGLEAVRLNATSPNRVHVPLPGFKLAAKSYLGGDLGASVRISGVISVGIGWSQLMLTPHADITVDGFNRITKIQGGYLSALSVFVQPGTMLTRTTRVYLQGGAARYSASFPSTLLGTFEHPPRLLSHKSTSIGGFVGGGCDVWIHTSDFGLLGVRLDAKYHRMTGNDAESDRSITLSGVRFGAGLSFSK